MKAQRTPWFKRGTRPFRAGVYRIRYNVAIGMEPVQTVIGYAYWSHRKGWCQCCPTAKEALHRNHYELGRVDWTINAKRIQPEWQGRMLCVEPSGSERGEV
jgi:hypothetical protein